MTDRLERLVNLTATLLATPRPVTLDELADRLEPSYPEGKAARRRQFERDKETLRELGIPISVESMDALGGELGYRIRPRDYYLPDLGLTPAERAALHIAVTAVRVGGDAARGGLAKLGGMEGGPAAPLADLEAVGCLPALFNAVATHARLTFEHRGTERHLEPYGVVHRFGHWYVVGHDLDRDAPRAFRADRIDGAPQLGPSNAFEPPPGVDPQAFISDPLTYGDDRPVTARVWVDAARADWVVDEVGEDRVAERRADGSVVVTLSVVNREAFRTFVIDLLDHAEVLDPPELREDLVEWLRAIASLPARRPRAKRTSGA